ncbi:MAG TPA: ABC transporter permease [Candidatus Paceibacterota bacterium]|nr:ABC transporter permease [Candidatus Paceibacterota bacterium]HMP18931.1 ABC transporter permease [Candidatus Paceibacterota bacterium]
MLNTVFKFSFRIFSREWKKFVLPFFSLSLTFIIILTVFLFTNSAKEFLDEKNRELIGGDIALEFNYEPTEEILQSIFENKIEIEKFSKQYNFSSIITKNNFDGLSTSVSISVIDQNYPLYGEILIENDTFRLLGNDEVYIDAKIAEKLSVGVGEEIFYANKNYTVAGIIKQDPRQIFSGFNFLPKIFLSMEGFERSEISTSLLRAEYRYSYKIKDFVLKNDLFEKIIEKTQQFGGQAEVSGITKTGFINGLSVVEQFLILIILLCCLLSVVNVYSGILYLLNISKKNFAVFLSLGFKKKNIILIIFLSLMYVLILSIFFGFIVSILIFGFLRQQTFSLYNINLPDINIVIPTTITIAIVFGVVLSSFISNLKKLLSLSPKILLSGDEKIEKRKLLSNLLLTTFGTTIPLFIIAIFLLNSFKYGILNIGGMVVLYTLVATIFYFINLFIYKHRYKLPLTIRVISAQKFSDGLFGIISITSIYIAMFSLSLLLLIQSTLIGFLRQDLGTNLPTVYILDIQKSQLEEIEKYSGQIDFFPNVGARIISIDDLEIQKSLLSEDTSVSRELGREYNLTYRANLLDTEKIIGGRWLSGIEGEVSVEADFAKRANINLGSKIVLSIQGFNKNFTVTSIRQVESRSGLPFFFFVFNPQDLVDFPTTFFGYSYLNDTEKSELLNFLSTNFPNISAIDTKDVSVVIDAIISSLLIIIVVVSIPPIILSLFLIVNLILSSFSNRKKQSAQFKAIGATDYFVKKIYYLEAISATLIGSVFGYITAIFANLIISKNYLKIDRVKIFDENLIFILLLILLLIFIISFVIWKSDKRSLRELLSYEEN